MTALKLTLPPLPPDPEARILQLAEDARAGVGWLTSPREAISGLLFAAVTLAHIHGIDEAEILAVMLAVLASVAGAEAEGPVTLQ